MDQTFDDHVLQDLMKSKNLNEEELFPYTKYENFTRVFVDDVSVFRKQTLSKETHFLCLEAVLYTLKESSWLISVEKCSLFSQKNFLGCT